MQFYYEPVAYSSSLPVPVTDTSELSFADTVPRNDMIFPAKSGSLVTSPLHSTFKQKVNKYKLPM